MAPLNGAAGKPANTVSRRVASKPVVPVLPLNYPQRPIVSRPSSTPSTASPSTPAHPNGVLHTNQLNGLGPTRLEHHVDLRNEGGQSSGGNLATVAHSVAPAQTSLVSASGAPTITSGEKVAATPIAAVAVPDQALASPTPTRHPVPPSTSFNGLRISDIVAHDPAVPSFQPTMVNRPPFHQPHASNGSLIFGQLHDSNASSPAPHPGGSFAPPPTGMMPYPPVTRAAAAVDSYGRPLIVSPTLDGYPQAMMNHNGPPTPHSFHGSQSSIPAEEASFSSYPSMNGQNGFPPDPTPNLQGSSIHIPGMNVLPNTLHLSVPPGYFNVQEQEDILAFVRHGVDDDSFTDCGLEVRFHNSPQLWDHPDYRRLQPLFRTPTHRFILSRSPTMSNLMKSLGTPAGGMIYLEPHDENIRPDVFNYVFRSLYGWSLGNGILPTDLRPRDARDDIKTTLSYIATARYLKLGGVYGLAVQRATILLSWDTIELAVAFVLPIVTLSHRGEEFDLPELLHQVLAFIINNFPRDFILDVNAGDASYARLPVIPPRNPNAPAIARSTPAGRHSRQSSTAQAHLTHNQRQPSHARFSQIRFGDISPEDQNGYESTNTSEVARRFPTPNETLLSRILLNLPFELLKQVLEHPHLAERSGELTHSARHKIITDIVAEREARRLSSVKNKDPQFNALYQALEKSTTPLNVGQLGDFYVNNMGFREEVFSGDGPYLQRAWTRGAPSATSA